MTSPIDTNLTLEQLEGRKPSKAEFESALVTRCYELYHRPLAEFTVEDLRLMIGQEFGLPFLIPLAIEKLESDPFVSGDYYPGDLLVAVLRVSNDFWNEHEDLCWRVQGLTASLPETLAELKDSIEKFQARDC